ncbi:dTDP-4-dehydrorhamnose 3,5-epimerase [uncultured Algoriphagus sp.]|uniref:dTDP-4-dehydrorhamnose 3,5-epimerase n=1 Tax=uncultured Algoriphagus sp. TaxID=417365 RepID=UPI0030EF09FD|tara:strand:- start:18153 stop:18677 length:525 start_codon:yes stop_codon:yes gene_type:complete
MIFTETKLKGAFVLEIKKLEDDRGFFGRAWCANEMADHGLKSDIKQVNMSLSLKKGTLRGMHYQNDPFQETKVVRCTKGAIFDIIIDLRKDSPTYKQWVGVELTEHNYKMLYVPEDFAHGFITLEDNTEVTYLVSQFYTPGAEAGIRWDDPAFGIELPIDPVIITDKDRTHPNY